MIFAPSTGKKHRNEGFVHIFLGLREEKIAEFRPLEGWDITGASFSPKSNSLFSRFLNCLLLLFYSVFSLSLRVSVVFKVTPHIHPIPFFSYIYILLLISYKSCKRGVVSWMVTFFITETEIWDWRLTISLRGLWAPKGFRWPQSSLQLRSRCWNSAQLICAPSTGKSIGTRGSCIYF